MTASAPLKKSEMTEWLQELLDYYGSGFSARGNLGDTVFYMDLIIYEYASTATEFVGEKIRNFEKRVLLAALDFSVPCEISEEIYDLFLELTARMGAIVMWLRQAGNRGVAILAEYLEGFIPIAHSNYQRLSRLDGE